MVDLAADCFVAATLESLSPTPLRILCDFVCHVWDSVSATMIVYYNGRYLPNSEVAISPDDRGFLFGDGVYEVIASYKSKLFKCTEHLDRLAHGLKELQIEGVDAHSLEKVAHELIATNKLEGADALIHIQVTRGVAPNNYELACIGTTPTVYAQARSFLQPVEQQQNGVNAILLPDQRWSRCDIKTIGLLPNILAAQRAREAKAFEVIFSRDGLLQEGSRSSILFDPVSTPRILNSPDLPDYETCEPPILPPSAAYSSSILS
jgi:D-alanine transaminase